MYDLSDRRPPRRLVRLLRALLPPGDQDAVVGDLVEEFRSVRRPTLGPVRAWLWMGWQAARSISILTLERLRPRRSGRRSVTRIDLPDRPGDGSMIHLVQDFRYGARTLLKSPGFALLTSGTLALAIGVNTAIFSLLNVVLLRPLPIADPDTMAFIYTANSERGIQGAPVSPADFLDLRREVGAFTELGAVDRNAAVVMTGWEEPVRLRAFRTTANVLSTWRIPVVLGRDFQQGDDQPGAERVALLAHYAWQERFGADPGIVGTAVELDGFPATIVGVVSPAIEFGTLRNAEIWVPLALAEATARRDERRLWVTGRLAPGASVEQARQEVAATGERLAREHPEETSGFRFTVYDMNQALAPPQTWTLLFMLALTVGLVMLIACSNVATMMLVRSAERARELAVRAAMGAGRRRILSQLLAESALLAVVAGVMGLAVARLALAALVTMAGQNSGLTNFLRLVSIDGNVLLFTLGVSLSAPMLFGLVPALRASRPDLIGTLKEGARGNAGAGEVGRRVLVSAQIALAMALLTVAGLAIRSIVEQLSAPIGFDTDRLLTMRIDLPAARYPDPESWRQYFDGLTERLATVPGVESVALTSVRYGGAVPPTRNFVLEGEETAAAEERPFAGVTTAGAGALGRLGIPLVRGREFNDGDDARGAAVAVVDAAAAERYWGGRDPVGTRIRLMGPGEPWREVVGVAGSLFSGDPQNPTYPAVYLPYRQAATPGMGVQLRTSAADPLAVAESARQAVWSIDPDQPIADVRTMEVLVDDNFRAGYTLQSIFVFFAFFALLMAGAGLYGVISFSVGQRTREIGIRMALGARGSAVLRLVARQTAWPLAAGLVAGGLGSVALGRVLASTIAGVRLTDPALVAGVLGVLLIAALLATWLPSRRAIRVEPVSALRGE